MTDRPIIMSAPMVRACLREVEKPGTGKRMTRRLRWGGRKAADGDGFRPSAWTKVKPGDRLWVRENWRPIGDNPLSECVDSTDLMFAASASEAEFAIFSWRPSIHLPRWGSRLTLVVTSTKVERLQDISKADVMAEGVRERNGEPLEGMVAGWHEPFATLWDSLHGAGAWDKNPEVVALGFTVHAANIDQLEKVAA